MHGLPKTQFHLIRGNHDILPEHLYEFAPFKSVADELEIGPFLLVHDADTAIPGDMYPIAGHVHPACRISGGHNQSLRLPCFYFGEEYALIPAFGRFTGTAVIKTHKGDHVFAIVEDKVLQLPT
jgi:metallophosphoesterase superfamily enzyme